MSQIVKEIVVAGEKFQLENHHYVFSDDLMNADGKKILSHINILRKSLKKEPWRMKQLHDVTETDLRAILINTRECVSMTESQNTLPQGWSEVESGEESPIDGQLTLSEQIAQAVSESAPGLMNVSRIPTLTLPALAGFSGMREYFASVIPIEMLVSEAKRFQVNMNAQRDLSKPHAKKIGKYLMEAESPYIGTLVCSLNTNEHVFENGKLHIYGEFTLDVIDGQHRMWAIQETFEKLEGNRDSFVPLLLYLNLTDEEQQDLFTSINGHQKKQSQTLLVRFEQHELGPRLTRIFANTPNQPFYGRVEETLGKVNGGGKLLTLITLRHMLHEHMSSARGQYDLSKIEGIEKLLSDITNYWSILAKDLRPYWTANNLLEQRYLRAFARIWKVIDPATIRIKDKHVEQMIRIAQLKGGTNGAIAGLTEYLVATFQPKSQ